MGRRFLLLALVLVVGQSATCVLAQDAATQKAAQNKLRAAAELRVEEQQRILGVMPNFNTSNVKDAAPLSAGQKFSLATKAAVDPFAFLAAGLDSSLSQAENDFPEYHQGATGYAKRLGSAYTDSFAGTMIGNALFPVLLKQDPRYFRKGLGSFSSRLGYALLSTVHCKNDNGSGVRTIRMCLGTSRRAVYRTSTTRPQIGESASPLNERPP